MRYADGGGPTPAGRRRREAVRMRAAELFEQRIKPSEVARRLRVSRKSAYPWHELWRDGGVRALASRGPGGSRCRLSPRCLESLRTGGPCGPWSPRSWPGPSACVVRRRRPSATMMPASPEAMARAAVGAASRPEAQSGYGVAPGPESGSPGRERRDPGRIAVVPACLVGSPVDVVD
ncbi:helix-turn-helix domain-containing protein [Streptomyces sp. NPDC004609]|uniref:helix-turn-helix domain-containing protein n=1 Tax=Streptomyces sp. NPDC004609 TaxID=3364704 RepID=UPI0036B702EB